MKDFFLGLIQFIPLFIIILSVLLAEKRTLIESKSETSPLDLGHLDFLTPHFRFEHQGSELELHLPKKVIHNFVRFVFLFRIPSVFTWR